MLPIPEETGQLLQESPSQKGEDGFGHLPQVRRRALSVSVPRSLDFENEGVDDELSKNSSAHSSASHGNPASDAEKPSNPKHQASEGKERRRLASSNKSSQ